ncbi:hypothetical protein [Streptomyces sp. CBMA123]|uniref:hypothetical protein n=1 Tax=Streptomyces sp. CBMA123 TaxID=1896313 RepID=UPI001661AD43|nr:hypothetical protein [Streptomyces sp. CBMA123]MBD0690832.1 hypothetical protein [Streptomyces sp. CBMA123]
MANGPGHPPAEDVETVIAFAFRAPSLWLLEFGGRVAVRETDHAPWEAPSGAGCGDPDTGFVVVDLDNEPSPGAPTAAQLVRQPLDEPPYLNGWARNPGYHRQRWRDARWQWTLVLSDHPLTVEQLARVREELAEQH